MFFTVCELEEWKRYDKEKSKMRASIEGEENQEHNQSLMQGEQGKGG